MQALRPLLRRGLATEAAAAPPKRTAFYEQHVRAGGKIVEFAGYALPVQYEGAGVLAEHLHTRTKASVFDVSHMGQVRLDGARRAQFLESLVVADLQGLKAGEAKLSLITNAKGGIIDDTVISNAGDHLYVVVNGACKYKDLAHFDEALKAKKGLFGDDLKITHLTHLSLLALQGPKAVAVLSKLLEKKDAESLPSMVFMTGKRMKVAGLDCRVTRCGYTGEDGFEISVESSSGPKLLDALTGADSDVRLAGLGARDSLRLEAGLCLYGHDISDETDPIEAALTWTISKSRREKTAAPFTGSNIILPKIGQKPAQKRVGFFVNGAPAREGAVIYAKDDTSTKIGVVTSGTFSPSLKKPLAMGYVKSEFSEPGKEVSIMVRKNLVPATVSKLPFVPTRYHQPKGKPAA